MMTNRIVLLLAILLFVPFFIVFFRYDYVPITDESYQLQAAEHLADGGGLVSNLGVNPFTDSKYQYLYQWPPGYSILVATLIRLGIPLDSSAILIKSITIALGLFFWLKLSSVYINKLAPKIIFISVTSFMVFAYNFLQTDLVIWSIFPIYSIQMLRLKTEKKQYVTSLVYIAIALVLFILFKYNAIVFFPITLVWLIYVFQNEAKKLISYSLAIFVPGVVTGLAIRYSNLNLANSTTDVINITSFNLYKLADFNHIVERLYIFLEYFFVRPLRIEIIIKYISNHAPILNNQTIIAIITLAVLVLTTRMIASLYNKSKNQNRLIAWFLINLISFVIFYFYLYAASNNQESYWPFSRSRYHLSLITLFYLLFISAATTSNIKVLSRLIASKIFAVSIYLSVFLIISLTSFTTIKGRYSKYNEDKKSLQEKIQNIQKESPIDFVIAEKPYNEMLVYNDFIPTYKTTIIDAKYITNNTSHPPFLLISGKNYSIRSNLVQKLSPDIYELDSLYIYYFK